MITLLSPTKTQSSLFEKNHFLKTDPIEIKKADFLLSLLNRLSVSALKKMMKISDALASKTRNAIDMAYKNKASLVQAIFLFQGDAFQKLDPLSLEEDALLFSQDHCVILSALYGYLRPLDAVHEYRIDMKDALKVPEYRNLYHYWSETVTLGINSLLSRHHNKIILNLASTEYSDLIDQKRVHGKMITVEFKVHKDRAYKTVGVYAKRGRGLLARYIIKNKIDDVEEIVSFNSGGFLFSENLSTQDKYVFILDV